MINPTTLILATLFFNAASVLGAPIRITAASDVVARATVGEQILPRVPVADVQPTVKRSVDDASGSPPSVAREVEIDTRDTVSSGSVETRDPLPEVDRLVRRFPRRYLHDYFEKRTPEPAPEPSPAPAPADAKPPAETRSIPEPEVYRRFPRRVYHDYYNKRSDTPQPEARAEPAPAPAPEARSPEAEPEVVRSFPRRVLAERYAKRSPSVDNVPRAPTPEPAPEPAPEPRAVGVEEPTLAKRQSDDSLSTTSTDAASTPTSTLPSESSTPTSGAPPTSSVSSTLPAGTPLPNGFVEKFVNDAISHVSNSSSSNGQVNIVISMSFSGNTVPLPNAVPPSGTSSGGSSSSADPLGTATPPTSTAIPSSTSTSTPASSSLPTSTDEGSSTTDGPSRPTSTGTPSESTDGTSSSDGTAEGGPSGPSSTDAERRSPEPVILPPKVSRRSTGLSGALWSAWNRRSFNN